MRASGERARWMRDGETGAETADASRERRLNDLVYTGAGAWGMGVGERGSAAEREKVVVWSSCEETEVALAMLLVLLGRLRRDGGVGLGSFGI